MIWKDQAFSKQHYANVMLSQLRIMCAILCSQKLSLTWSMVALSQIQLHLRNAAAPRNVAGPRNAFILIVYSNEIMPYQQKRLRMSNNINQFCCDLQWHRASEHFRRRAFSRSLDRPKEGKSNERGKQVSK
jgi:hypothetical protein